MNISASRKTLGPSDTVRYGALTVFDADYAPRRRTYACPIINESPVPALEVGVEGTRVLTRKVRA